jgi:pilus assembly protein CpaB
VFAGSLLKPDDIGAIDIETGKEDADAILDTPERRAALAGAMLRRGLAAGAQLHDGDLLHPGDRGFLAAVLQPGMRAVTVGVDAVTGSAGLIWPGDHVDLILTQTLPEGGTAAGRGVAAETVLSDVRVIAIDQQIVQGAEATPKEPQARTVTLEVTPEQTERVSVAVHLGRLSLAVRAATPAPGGQARIGIIWAGDVSPALRASIPVEASGLVHVHQGVGDTKDFHF